MTTTMEMWNTTFLVSPEIFEQPKDQSPTKMIEAVATTPRETATEDLGSFTVKVMNSNDDPYAGLPCGTSCPAPSSCSTWNCYNGRP